MDIRGAVFFAALVFIASVALVSAACTDSDSGVNVSVLGTTSGLDAYGGNASVMRNYTDRCQNAAQVLEFFCGEAESVVGANVSCASGCDGGVCISVPLSAPASLNATPNNTTSPNGSMESNASSVSVGSAAFPDPLAPESEDFFEEFTVEDFLTPDRVASPQPELPEPREVAPVETSVTEVIFQPGSDAAEFEPRADKLLLNLTVNTTAMPPRLIGRGTFVDKSLLFPQFLPNVRPDAGLYATCDLAYQNASVKNPSLSRGSSTVLYLSALSPSFKCPRVQELDVEIAYRLINVGVAEIYTDGVAHACRTPWYSPSLEQAGISVVRTPFVLQRVIVQPGPLNKVIRGSFVVPVRAGGATNFNHFYHTSPRVVYLEAFRGNNGDYISMEFTLVRCAEGKGVSNVSTSSAPASEDIPEPGLLKRMWCSIVSWFGRDYESCLYG